MSINEGKIEAPHTVVDTPVVSPSRNKAMLLPTKGKHSAGGVRLLRDYERSHYEGTTTEREIESNLRSSFLEQMKEVAKLHVEGVEAAMEKTLTAVKKSKAASPKRAPSPKKVPKQRPLSPTRPKKQAQEVHNGRIQHLLERYSKLQGGRGVAYVPGDVIHFVDADGDSVVFAIDPQTKEVVVTVDSFEICRPYTISVDKGAGMLDLDDGAAMCPLPSDFKSLFPRLAAMLDSTSVRHNLHSTAIGVSENFV